jgi:hypothetical protein
VLETGPGEGVCSLALLSMSSSQQVVRKRSKKRKKESYVGGSVPTTYLVYPIVVSGLHALYRETVQTVNRKQVVGLMLC